MEVFVENRAEGDTIQRSYLIIVNRSPNRNLEERDADNDNEYEL